MDHASNYTSGDAATATRPSPGTAGVAAFDHLVDKSCKLVEAIEAFAEESTRRNSNHSTISAPDEVVRSSDEVVQTDDATCTSPLFDEADYASLKGIVKLLPVGGTGQLTPFQKQQLSNAALQLWCATYLSQPRHRYCMVSAI